MNIRSLVISAAGLLALAQAKELDYDSVVPFPETKASSTEYSTALQFKPQLNIASGCQPYPAVDSAGNTNKGLAVLSLKSCKGSSTGSQVYGRSKLYEGYWAIMYAWYFPRDRVLSGGRRHSWEHAIVWVEKSAADDGEIASVTTTSRANEYSTFTPPDADMVDDSSIKLVYDSKGLLKHYLNVTTEAGDFQDLVLWGDLTDAAQVALNTYDWGSATVPFNDDNFEDNLDAAFPFES